MYKRQIADMFAPDGAPQISRPQLRAKADEIDALISQLRALSDGLRHAAQCPAPTHMDCPSFQRLMRAAAAGRIKLPRAVTARPR